MGKSQQDHVSDEGKKFIQAEPLTDLPLVWADVYSADIHRRAGTLNTQASLYSDREDAITVGLSSLRNIGFGGLSGVARSSTTL